MRHVSEHRETLTSLESVWDVLNLLGQLSGTTAEIGDTKAAFSTLTGGLLDSLARTTFHKRVQEISAKAQVAIDILVRNLFERTADIGFLAMDDALRRYASGAAAGGDDFEDAGAAGDAAAMGARLQAYVAKYSVYRDVILLAPDGTVLARLPSRDGAGAPTATRDALLQQALRSDAAYLESYAASDLFPGQGATPLYASRVADARGGVLGALYLCFDFDNEMRRIFSGLEREGDCSVIALLDAGGRVIASSDPYQIALGAPFALDAGDGQVLRFAGRSYLATRRAARGFQGYLGPGWSALALVPLELAFLQESDHDDAADASPAAAPAGPQRALVQMALASGSAFPPELRQIPRQAEAIQRELNRCVWNANIRQGRAAQAAMNPAFSKVLLAEIVRTGTRMRDVFTRSIGNLQTMVVAAELDDCRFLAALAIDILDRNLYERANDCRWWALDPVLCALLEQDDGVPRREQMAARLAAINDLYTVYDSLLLFDAAGVAVAASRAGAAEWIGRRLEAPWCAQALALRDPESYVASEFVPDPLYGGRPTYVYATALRGAAGRTVGGIAIVFDSAPQFDAILRAALPSQVAGALALFVDRAGTVIASTDARWAPGDAIALPVELLERAGQGGAAQLIVLDGQVMAAGVRLSSGYREYRGTSGRQGQPVLALVCVPLGAYDASLPAAGADDADDAGAAPVRAAGIGQHRPGAVAAGGAGAETGLGAGGAAGSLGGVGGVGGAGSVGGGTSAAGASAPGASGAAGQRAAAGPSIEIASFYVGDYLLGVPAAAVVEAIPFGGFVRLPNAAAKVAGATIYQGDTMMIYDLHSALGVAPAGRREDMLTVVLADVGGHHFGVQVDRLGEIPVVALADVAPVERLFAGVAPVLASIVKSSDARPAGPMLTVLAVEQMSAMLRHA